MGAHRPARTVVPSGDLHFGALVEINAMAAVADGSR
jgi:enamine deaminase RidA (YjgF/YER057c/UK114 family)